MSSCQKKVAKSYIKAEVGNQNLFEKRKSTFGNTMQIDDKKVHYHVHLHIYKDLQFERGQISYIKQLKG